MTSVPKFRQKCKYSASNSNMCIQTCDWSRRVSCKVTHTRTTARTGVFSRYRLEIPYSRSVSWDGWWRWSCAECVVHSPPPTSQVSTPIGHRSACGRVGKPCYCGRKHARKEKMTFREHPRLGIAYLMTEYIRERRVPLLSL